MFSKFFDNQGPCPIISITGTSMQPG
jgi:hypothetical protein